MAGATGTKAIAGSVPARRRVRVVVAGVVDRAVAVVATGVGGGAAITMEDGTTGVAGRTSVGTGAGAAGLAAAGRALSAGRGVRVSATEATMRAHERTPRTAAAA